MALRRATYLTSGALGLAFWSVGVLLVRRLAPELLGTWVWAWGLACLVLTLAVSLILRGVAHCSTLAASVLGHSRAAVRQRDAEAALGESERALATFLSNLPGMAYRCLDDDHWTMLFVSEGARRLTGYGPDDLTNNARVAYKSLILPEDRAMVRRAVDDCVSRDTSFELRYRLRTASGEVRWAWEQGRRIASTTDRPDVLEGLVLDVSDVERSAAEREALLSQVQEQAGQLRETAAQLQQIMASVPEGVLLLDAECRIVRANPIAEDALRTLQAVINDAGSLVRLGNRRMADLLIAPRRRGIWREVHVGQRTFAISVQAVERGPVAKGWVVVLNEVTQDYEAAQRAHQQERLAAVGQLAAGIAHDFNNVLAVITLYTQLAQRARDLPATVRDQLQVVVREASRGSSLIRQILDFGRRGPIAPEPLDLAPFFEDLAELLRTTLGSEISIMIRYEPGAYRVYADPAQLRQAMINLALNARDAMPDGGTLTFTLSRLLADGQHAALLSEQRVLEWILIDVTDTGHGMSAEVLSRLFEPFFTTKDHGGTGLGLAQVHGIIGQHDGTITATSQSGVGTTFFIYLPALTVPELEAVASRGMGEVLLLVEAHDVARRTLANALEYMGYRVLTVRSAEALGVLGAQSAGDVWVDEVPHASDDPGDSAVALVVVDLSTQDGEEAALLQAVRDVVGSIPVVALTRGNTSPRAELSPGQELAGWLPAPPQLAALHGLIAEVLSGIADAASIA